MKKKSKTRKENENKKFQKWQIVLAILAIIIPSLVSIWNNGKTKNSEPDPQNNIIISIKNIRESFHPNDIPYELDTISFVKTFRNYQTNVIDVCDAWEILENKLSHAEPANYEDFDKSSCRGRLELYQKGMKEMNDQMMSIIINVMSLSIEAETLYEQSNWEINIDEFGYLTNLVKLKGSMSNKYLTKAGRYIEKGKLKESMTEIDKMKKDKDYLKFDNAFFKYCIEVKETCDNILKDNGIRY